MAERPLIQDALKTLHYMGINPYVRNVFCKIRFSVVLIISCAIFMDITLQTLLNIKEASLEVIIISFGTYQAITKALIIHLYRNKLRSVINKTQHFWPINKYGEEMETNISNIYDKIKKLIRVMTIVLWACLFLFSLRPVFVQNTTLPIPTYLGKLGTPIYVLTYMTQILYMFFVILMYLGFDSTFISLVVNIICEFKLVKAGLVKLPIKETFKSDGVTVEKIPELGELIIHHNLILDSVEILKQSFSPILLSIFSVNMFTVGLCLLCIVINGIFNNIGFLCMYGIVVVLFIGQMFFYCAAGAALTNEGTEIADVAFETNWWMVSGIDFRRAIGMIIQRSNKSEMLSAGGIFSLNLNNFTQILKTTFSFFTFMQAVYKDKSV